MNLRLLIATVLVSLLAGTALAQDTNPGTDQLSAAPLRFNLALASAGSGGLVAQAAVSHDTLLAGLGVRLAAEYGFGVVPFSVTAGIIEHAPLGPVELYAGLGVGTSFETTGALIYGELLLGGNYRLSEHFAVYAEGRFRPYFDGTAQGLGGLGAGLQIRF